MPAADRHARCGGRYSLALLALVVVVAAWLRFHLLTAKSFWFDEGFSVGVARLGWTDFLQLLWHREANMAAYYVLLRFWLKFGIGEFFVRSLSVVFALATIPAIYALGARLFRPRVGLIAALLFAVNAFSVRYSQEARGYALLVLLVTLSSWFLVRSIEEGTSRNWWLYTLCAVLTVYTHFYGILAIAAQSLSLAFLPRLQLDRTYFFRFLRYFFYSLLPLALFLWRTGSQPMSWIPALNAGILAHFFRSFAGNGGNLLLAACALAWIFASVTALGVLRHPRSVTAWHYALLLLSFVFPILSVVGISAFKSAFLARYLIICLPASVLLAAEGISRCRPAWLRAAFLIIVVALSVRGTVSYYRADFDNARDNWRAAASYLLANARPGDGIFFYTSPGRFTFEYYRLQAGRPLNDPAVIYPASDGGITYRDFLVLPLGEVLQQPLAQPPRVWLFLNNHRASGHMDMGSDVMCAYYAKRYRLVSQHTVDGLDLFLYQR